MKRFIGNIVKKIPVEEPLRSEMFSSEQMKQHGKMLAGLHQLTKKRTSLSLLTRLTENQDILLETHRLLIAAVKEKRLITPGGEWLLDNFYLIEEQIRTAKRHLPKSYHRQLPLLINGPSAGLPRVYDIALEMIAHGDGRVDPEILSGFMESYQKITSLDLGELWAIPIMLRLALIENLRRIATSVASVRTDQDLADFWADEMFKIAQKDPKNLILVVADMSRSKPPMSNAFVAELTRRFQAQSPSLSLPLTWIKQWLSEEGLTIEQMVHLGNQSQAANQVSISNSIGSLRFLGVQDWREFVESMSIVENVLRNDPGRFYHKMDFATRDRYRHVIETIAKSCILVEGNVAEKAIQLAKEAAAKNGVDDRRSHVGYYLIDKGLVHLKEAVGVHFSGLEISKKIAKKFPLFLYLGAIGGVTISLSGVFIDTYKF